MMNFERAYIEMLHGKKVRRAGWKGFWYLDKVTGKLVIHRADGFDVEDGAFSSVTVQNTLAKDWQIVKE